MGSLFSFIILYSAFIISSRSPPLAKEV